MQGNFKYNLIYNTWSFASGEIYKTETEDGKAFFNSTCFNVGASMD